VPGGEDTDTGDEPGRLAKFFAVLVVVACVVGVVLLIKGLYPADLNLDDNPDFIDTIFNNKAVIWAARLLLFSAAFVLAFAGIFIVVSTIVRMKNKEWLRKAGPFEVSETAIKDLEDQIEFWRDAALVGQDEVQSLTKQLEESDEVIEQLQLQMDDG
jgi:hypothetical protein